MERVALRALNVGEYGATFLPISSAFDGLMSNTICRSRTGYVYGRYVRRPLDYRVAFNKIDGAWKLTAFVKGD